MKKLSEHQRQFSRMVGLLLVYLPILSEREGKKFEVAIADAQSKPEYGVHSIKPLSFHFKKLAIDLDLFIDGVYQETSEAHKPLGDFWKFLGGTWGGDFIKKDGNHYSYLEGFRLHD